MRAVVDTNVLISGLLWRGSPHALLAEARAGRVLIVSSPALLAELTEVISRRKVYAILASANTSREQAMSHVRQLTDVIQPTPLEQPVCRDPDDDELLAVAIAGKVDLIISGDNDLLTLGSFRGMPIVAPGDALAYLAAPLEVLRK